MAGDAAQSQKPAALATDRVDVVPHSAEPSQSLEHSLEHTTQRTVTAAYLRQPLLYMWPITGRSQLTRPAVLYIAIHPRRRPTRLPCPQSGKIETPLLLPEQFRCFVEGEETERLVEEVDVRNSSAVATVATRSMYLLEFGINVHMSRNLAARWSRAVRAQAMQIECARCLREV